jgi:secondary thiamine-phosphate synthase enzyme
MTAFENEYRFDTDGDGTIVDLTAEAREAVAGSGITTGQLTVMAPGATAGITTIEYEPGLLRDLPEFFERIIPSGVVYGHDATWGDGNGFSHLRSALVGPSVTVPVSGGELVLGTWQQIVFLDFDNRPRSRRVHFSVVGE